MLLQYLLPLYLQEAYSVQDTLIITDFEQEEPDSRYSPDPRKASMYSAVFPGLGQIYNRKYWKVPIVWGGFAALTWYTIYANDELNRYSTAIYFRTDGNPDTIDEFALDLRYTDAVLNRFKDFYRRQRDRTVIWTVLFYALNIVDAAVDAHLFEFDVSEDLGIKIGPSFPGMDNPVANRPAGYMGPGIRISVKF